MSDTPKRRRATPPGERLVDVGRRASNRYLDNYETLLERVISIQQKLAEQSRNDAISSLVTAQTNLTRQVSTAYTSAARKLISP